MEHTFFVAGGDTRQTALAGMLRDRGCRVSAFGFLPGDRLTPEIAAQIGAAEIVLLPLPAADASGSLNAHSMEKKLPMETLWPLLHPRQKIFGGMFSERDLRNASEYHLLPVDYFRREEFVLRNAYITAEGALQLTMEHLSRTVRGSRCLVLGYGRIGRYLSRLLLSMGAHVTGAARKSSDLVQAELNGCASCALADLARVLPECDVIYNTVPHMLLDRELLQFVPQKCLCIDLASKPGGMDFDAAEKLGIQAIWALSLPGKLAPESAGAAILDTVLQILTEQEVPA